MINIGNSWQNFFDGEQEKDYYKNLRNFLAKNNLESIIW